jgi:hypothetical protein
MGPNDLNLALEEDVACNRPGDGSSTAVASGSGDWPQGRSSLSLH